MISRLQGVLRRVEGGRAEIQCGEMCYEVLVPACDEQRLGVDVGEPVELYTLHYLESHGQGSSFVPRLIGFRSREDRSFFELFTTVKGLGNRKALRALKLPFGVVAEAIAAEDLATLTSLPEIGRRTAQTIVAELQGKVDGFVELKPDDGGGDGTPGNAQRASVMADACEVLVQLGESRMAARRLVERAVRSSSEVETAEDLVSAAVRLRD